MRAGKAKSVYLMLAAKQQYAFRPRGAVGGQGRVSNKAAQDWAKGADGGALNGKSY